MFVFCLERADAAITTRKSVKFSFSSQVSRITNNSIQLEKHYLLERTNKIWKKMEMNRKKHYKPINT